MHKVLINTFTFYINLKILHLAPIWSYFVFLMYFNAIILLTPKHIIIVAYNIQWSFRFTPIEHFLCSSFLLVPQMFLWDYFLSSWSIPWEFSFEGPNGHALCQFLLNRKYLKDHFVCGICRVFSPNISNTLFSCLLASSITLEKFFSILNAIIN